MCFPHLQGYDVRKIYISWYWRVFDITWLFIGRGITCDAEPGASTRLLVSLPSRAAQYTIYIYIYACIIIISQDVQCQVGQINSALSHLGAFIVHPSQMLRFQHLPLSSLFAIRWWSPGDFHQQWHHMQSIDWVIQVICWGFLHIYPQ